MTRLSPSHAPSFSPRPTRLPGALIALLLAALSSSVAHGDTVSTPRQIPLVPRVVAPSAAQVPAPAPAGGSLVTRGLDFQGSQLNVDSGFIPPDTMGAVGPSHIVELINGRFDVYNKATGAQVATGSLDGFWTNVVGVTIPDFNDLCSMGTCTVSGRSCTSDLNCVRNFTYDPRIVYDPASGRWFATSLDATNPTTGDNNIYVARSDTSDPTGDWDGLLFDADTVAPAEFHDYDTLALDADGLYTCTQDFDGGGNESCYSIPKADLLLAAPSIANMTRFEATPAGLPAVNGSIQAALDFGASVGRAPLLGTNGGALVRSSILGAGAAGATLGAIVGITGDPGHAPPPAARQPSVGPIENVAPRFVSNVVKQGTSLWAVHAVLGSSSNSALRWYEINETTNTVVQTGLIEDPNQDFHEPSITVNSLGNVVIGYTCSGPSLAASACVSVGSTTGGMTTFDPPLVLRTGAGYYWRDFSDPPDAERNRWGDYSATVIDPVDPCTFWTFQEFVAVSAVGTVGPSPLPEGGDWGIQITEMTFDSCAKADLSITKIDLSDPVAAGTNLDYKLDVTNLGPSRAHNVVVTDTLPAGVTFVSVVGPNWNCSEAAGTITCNWQGGNPVGSLAAGQTANPIAISVDVAPTTLGTITNTSTVSSDTPDPVPGNNTAAENTQVIAVADLAATKTAEPNPVPAGGVLKSTITVVNNGPSNAPNATMTESVPANTTFLAVVSSPPGWTCVTPPVGGTGNVVCTIPSMPVGAPVEFVISFAVSSALATGATVTNSVTVSSDGTDPDPTNNPAGTSTPAVRLVPALGGFGLAASVLILFATAWRAFGRGRTRR